MVRNWYTYHLHTGVAGTPDFGADSYLNVDGSEPRILDSFDIVDATLVILELPWVHVSQSWIAQVSCAVCLFGLTPILQISFITASCLAVC